ncbi:MAG: hypothetical protein VB064_11630 [Oscillospiraceae bacterium]|nr:hypothetical protein [Oscillospiraceae bacterium]
MRCDAAATKHEEKYGVFSLLYTLQGDRSGGGGAISPLRGETIQKSRSVFEWQDKVSDGHPNTA